MDEVPEFKTFGQTLVGTTLAKQLAPVRLLNGGRFGRLAWLSWHGDAKGMRLVFAG